MTNPGGHPLNVLLTFDVEIWCSGWDDIDGRFPQAFRRYIHGASQAGNYALPKTLEILNAHGLKGVFFVEPLFAAHFGPEPLAEIVGLIRDAGQEVQLHLHPEWQDESRVPIIENHAAKRQHLFMYDVDEQTALIGHGLRLLNEAGVGEISAFRAGSFACNEDTFTALKRNGIRHDSSLNITMGHSGTGLPAEARRTGSHWIDGTLELPLSVSRGRQGSLRHMQIGACSYEEMVQSIQSAHASGWRYFNVLSHNFEMLVPGTSLPDWVVVKRFTRLCEFLGKHQEKYPTTGFGNGEMTDESPGLALPSTTFSANLKRNAEQGYRRVAQKWAEFRQG